MKAGIAPALAWTAIVALALGTAGVPRGLADEGTTRAALSFAAGSTLEIEGKSTMHDWESKTQTVHVVFLRAAGSADPGLADLETLVRENGVRGMEVEIPVTTLHSEKSGLDKNMMKSLQAEKYPSIRFRMTGYRVTSPATADTVTLKVEGALTVTGVEKPATLEARAWKSARGEWIEGVEPLRMSDFGIKPPTMMLGALKVADAIDIHYHLLLAPGTIVAGPQTPAEK